MSGVLTTAAVMMCPHGGMVQPIPGNTRVLAGGQPVLRMTDQFVIAGCPFLIVLVPHPCVSVSWVQGSAHGTVLGDPVLTQASLGMCVAADQAVQGPVLVVSAQAQVMGL